MIDEQSVYQEAKRRSDEIVQTAETKSRELLRAANSYLDDALRQTEEAVAASLEKVRVARAQFRAAAAPEQPGRHRGRHAAGCGGQRVHQRLSPTAERTKFS